jgi:hypothetical protein
MTTKEYTIAVHDDGVEARYDNKPQAILAIVASLYQTLLTHNITMEELMEIRRGLILLHEAEKHTGYNSEYIKFTLDAEEVEPFVTKDASTIEMGYVVTTDFPISFHTDLNGAKAEVLFELLDIYTSMNEITSEVQSEFMEDLKTLLGEKEPLILGCGQITEVVCK